MKITFWVQNSSQQMEQQVEDYDEVSWNEILDDLQMGVYSPDFVLLYDEGTHTSHYVRTSCIDVMKVEW